MLKCLPIALGPLLAASLLASTALAQFPPVFSAPQPPAGAANAPQPQPPGVDTPPANTPPANTPPANTPPATAPPTSPPAIPLGGPPTVRYSDEQLRKAMRGDQTGLPDTGLGDGLLPPDAAARVFQASSGPEFNSRLDWDMHTEHWAASGVWHHPLYFEDVILERHGHARGPYVQPFVSAGRFFGTFSMLPYKWRLDPPRARFHALGHYRPGSPAPLVYQRPRWRWDAGVVQAASATGLILIVP